MARPLQLITKMTKNTVELTSADYYTDPTAHYSYHEPFLRDPMFMDTFSRMVDEGTFKNKVVLDIGSGLGILSLLAARAGAKRVIGIETSSIVNSAREIAESNGFSNVITFHRGTVENVQIEKVDIIISNWMSGYPTPGNHLQSVLNARDKWLKTNGIIMPNTFSLWATAIKDEEVREQVFEWWKDVYGFNMTCLETDARTEPLYGHCTPDMIVTGQALLKTIDLYTAQTSDLSFIVDVNLTAMINDDIHAILVYFSFSCKTPTHSITISTGPFDKLTCWKQSIFYLNVVHLYQILLLTIQHRGQQSSIKGMTFV